MLARFVRMKVIFLALALLASMVVPVFAQSGGGVIVTAQAQKPRTIFDLLFGPSEKKPPAKTPTSSPSVTILAPLAPVVEKAAGAVRVAVFGDSMAIDLSRALERAHADDPNIVVTSYGVSASGFVRDDYFDWNQKLSELIAQNAFDIGVVMIGTNDRQPIGQDNSLTDAWKTAYSERLNRFLSQLRTAGKPVIWVGLPPMQAPTYSAAMARISSLHRAAAFSGGAEFVDIYDRFADENGAYSDYGPDLSGQNALMRKSDGIHLSTAGSDKLAFYVDQALKRFYSGGAVSEEVSDPLDGTDAQKMPRPPYQGLGQIRLLEVAGAVVGLNGTEDKAQDLVGAGVVPAGAGFDINALLKAPKGRADAFGDGVAPESRGPSP